MIRAIGGHVSASGGADKVIQRSLDIQANCTQFFGGSPRTWDRKIYSDEIIRNYLESANLLQGPNYIHALYLVNLTSINSEIISKSLTALNTDIINAKNLNCKGVIIHTGSLQGQKWQDIELSLLNKIELLLSISDQVQIILENTAGQKDKIGTIHQLGIIINKLNSSNLKICLDTAHLHGAGYNLSSSQETDHLINELTELDLINNIACIHLNESTAKIGSGRDLHANLNEGNIGSQALKSFINLPQLKHLPLILEVPGNQTNNTNGPTLDQIKIAKQWSGN